MILSSENSVTERSFILFLFSVSFFLFNCALVFPFLLFMKVILWSAGKWRKQKLTLAGRRQIDVLCSVA